jgi:hypothetical protein
MRLQKVIIWFKDHHFIHLRDVLGCPKHFQAFRGIISEYTQTLSESLEITFVS